MKTVGRRHLRPMEANASGDSLAQTAGMSETLQRLRPTALFPKGVYRYKTHEEADRHWRECVAQAMARLSNSSK